MNCNVIMIMQALSTYEAKSVDTGHINAVNKKKLK